MNRYPNKTYKQKFREIFYRVRIHPWYQRIMLLPIGVRIFFAIFLFLFGLIGLVTPIPAGWVMILASGVLVFGLRVVRRHSVRLFFMLRLHRAYEWVRYRMKKR